MTRPEMLGALLGAVIGGFLWVAPIGTGACTQQQAKTAISVAEVIADAVLKVLPLLGAQDAAEAKAALDRGDQVGACRIAAKALRARQPSAESSGVALGTTDAVALVLAVARESEGR